MNYLSINLNEINLLWLKKISSKYNFKNINVLLRLNFIHTTSENKYQNLEPWIQWPTYYQGKSFEEHKCFHLGDAELSDSYSIYDWFQRKGKDVLALSPMNCTFSANDKSLLIHDPWSTKGVINGKENLNHLWDAIRFFVNENSKSTFKIKYIITLIFGLLKFARLRNYFTYLKLLIFSVFFKWARAIFLDLFLFDIFYTLIKDKKYKYSSVFLNAGAHIQHHYLYDSFVYKSDGGKHKNPLNYSSVFTKLLDPLYQIYKIYDRIAYDLLGLGKQFNIEITTGLQQIKNPNPYYQYRIKSYEKFFRLFNINYDYLEKKMSRDIYIYFNNQESLKNAENNLNKFKVNKKPLFKIWTSKKDKSLFVKIAFQGNIDDFKNTMHGNQILDLRKYVSIVSIENAIHQSEGWHINNFHRFKKKKIPLKDLTKELYGFKKRQ
jgi:hypothetical protein